MRFDKVLRQKAGSALRLARRTTRIWRQQGTAAAMRQVRQSFRGFLHRPVPAPSRFDLEHGVDTSGIVRIAQMEIDSPNYVYGVFYKASAPQPFLAVLDQLQLTWSQYHFVDMGSGKGLVLLLASRYPFRAITGVEFAADLHRIAEANLTKFRQGRTTPPMESVCGDAAAYDFPPTPLLLYFYDPFLVPVLRQVMRNLRRTYNETPRPIVVVYHGAPSTSVLADETARRQELFSQSGIFEAVTVMDDGAHTVYQSKEALDLHGTLWGEKQSERI